MPSSNYTITNILNYNFDLTSTPPADPLYFGLSTSLVGAADTGATVTEPNVWGYLRVPYDNNKTNWSVSTLGTLHNNLEISFPQSNGGEWSNIGTPILSVFISDDSNPEYGNILAFYTLDTPLVVPDLTQVSFPIGAITVTEPTTSATLRTINNILNYNYGLTTYTPDDGYGVLMFGLSTSIITAAGLSSVTEPPIDRGYERIWYDSGAGQTWTSPSGSPLTITNTMPVEFPAVTGSWGAILCLFIADSSGVGTGNVLWYSTLSPRIIVQNGASPVTFGAGDIAIPMT